MSVTLERLNESPRQNRGSRRVSAHRAICPFDGQHPGIEADGRPGHGEPGLILDTNRLAMEALGGRALIAPAARLPGKQIPFRSFHSFSLFASNYLRACQTRAHFPIPKGVPPKIGIFALDEHDGMRNEVLNAPRTRSSLSERDRLNFNFVSPFHTGQLGEVLEAHVHRLKYMYFNIHIKFAVAH